MLTITWYLLKIVLCSGILLGYYWLALRNKVFHQYNRFYLLVTVVLAVLLPFIQIDFWQQKSETANSINVIEAISYGNNYMNDLVINATPAKKAFNWQLVAVLVYSFISLVLLFGFVKMLFEINRLLKKYLSTKLNDVTFINTDNEKGTPFSFFKYIFWNRQIDITTTEGNQIFKHELAHIKERHTHDKLFINIILIFGWFNPFFWLIRKELNMIHEFIADKKAVKDYDTAAFAAMVLQTTYPQHQFTITNNFFYSPIKRRLAMLLKNKNSKVNYWSRVLVLPVAVLVFAAFTFKTKSKNTGGYKGEKITVAIDAGHGGNDFGASSLNGNLEKDITVAIAKKIKELNINSSIDIVLTRESDIYLTPVERAEAATNKKANLLISIHIDKTPKPNTRSGVDFFIAKDQYSIANESKILASSLIEAFTSNYKLPVAAQPKQRENDIRILQNNNFPSVLIETGVINNDKDAAYLQTNEAKETIARNILNAIEKFAASNLQSVAVANNSLLNESKSNSFFVNTKYSDTNYLKTTAYKNKALVIIDSKEIGNVGMNYVEKENINYSSIVIYNPEKAKRLYGEKGLFGAIYLIQKDLKTGLNINLNNYNKTNLNILEKIDSSINGKFEDALILFNGKEIKSEELKKLEENEIEEIKIFKGKNLDDHWNTDGKKIVVDINAKSKNYGKIFLNGKELKSIYIVNGIEQSAEFDPSSINSSQIEHINILKGESAIAKYGNKGKGGIIEIITKKNTPSMLFVVDGVFCDESTYKNILPENIESITILKGESAILLYGDKGKNGVKQIISKNNFTLNKYHNRNILKSATPLYVINGVVVDKSFDISTILPENIESINILKDNAAIALFGETGKMGVIAIELKNDLRAKYSNTNTEFKAKEKIVITSPYKMNAIYLGINNPIYVTVIGIKQEDIELKIIEGDGILNGSMGKYKLIAESSNDIIIGAFNAKTKKLLSSTKFSIKRVPEPVDKFIN